MQDKLDAVINVSDVGETTLRGYFIKLLTALWDEGESFSGKRPFGNSGWEIDLAYALCDAGLIDAKKNKWDEWSYDKKKFNKFVFDAIAAL